MSSSITGKALVIDDEPDVCRIIAYVLGENGFEVHTANDGESGLEILRQDSPDLAFVDINLPGLSGFDVLDEARKKDFSTDVIIITGKTTVANAIEATRRGAYDYLTKPFDLDSVVDLARRVMERRRLTRRLERHKPERPTFEGGRAEIVGQSPAMQEIYKMIGRVAAGTTTILLQGESGTGKEIIARAIHTYSDREKGPFVAVNCSAIPADLLESEMFGHERGAFTGATDRHTGKFEQANGGTLFLDEISDMPLGLQAKLLRVLQEREFSRVGGHELLPADCRIIAATNKYLEDEVGAGRFREDLYFRLKVVLMQIPPLRERREDIPLLVDFFVDRINRRETFNVTGVSPDAISLLVSHAWPGNVRELENVLLRAAALAPDRLLTAEDIPLGGKGPEHRIDDSMPLDDVVAVKLRDYLDSLGTADARDLYARIVSMVEKPLLQAVLEKTDGNQLRAAEILGINRNTLRKKISDHCIEITRKRS